MHRTNNSSSKSFTRGGGGYKSRDSFGRGRPSTGGGKWRSGGKRPFAGNRARPGRRSGGASIDINRFINKAQPKESIEVFEPKHKFGDFAMHEDVKKNLESLGFVTPTPIQDGAIPHALQGSDVVGIANTGTGKTLAFLIPILDKMFKNPREQALVIAPTRELAQQIEQDLRKIIKNNRVNSVVCVGGTSVGKQLSDLRRPYNFCIGTPGRIKDMVERKALVLKNFKTIVLDEADRMLDMGFINDIEKILSELPEERQTLFFSATMPSNVTHLINKFLREPVTVSVKTHETSNHVEQDVVRITGGQQKIDVLSDMLSKDDFDKVLIFGRTKRGVDRLSRDLGSMGFKTDSIHGDKTQPYRQKALKRFKDNSVNVLIATDVAARGLDIPNVSHVINYDIPETYEDYVHRIGRTGRAGKRGIAFTFVG